MNRNRKKMIKNYIHVSLAAAMALTSLTGCSSQSSSTEISEEAKANVAKKPVVNSHGATDGKSEMVYVIANPDGSAKKTIVSEWLSNPSELDIITDYSELKDIENVKGEQRFSVDEDGNLMWEADGSDIYYQGTTDEKLPIGVKITYKLDGEEISAKELAGKSGRLTMTFSYTNNMTKEIEVNGEKETIYMPFAVISGAMFDNSKVSNITVTNGKAVNDGDNTVVVGFALPGLKESLGLNELEINGEKADITIPESVEIMADVVDFSLLTSITVVDNSLLKNITMDEDGNFDLSSLSDTLGEMTDASTKLVNGSSDLYDGTAELADGTAELESGASDLKDGAKQLQSGASDLNDGAGKLQSGAAELESGATTLKDGIAKVDAGAASLVSGTSALKAGVCTLDTGIVQLLAGAGALDTGIGQLMTSVEPLPSSATTLLNGLKAIKVALKSNNMASADKYGIYEAAYAAAAGCDQVLAGIKSGNMTSADKYGIYEGAYAISAGAEAIQKGAKSGDSSSPASFGIYEAADAVEKGLSILPGKVETAVSSLSATDSHSAYSCDLAAAAAIGSVINSENLTAEQKAALQQALAYIDYSEQYETGVAQSLGSVDMSSAVIALEGIKSGAENISSGAAAISAGAGSIMTGADKVCAGVTQIKTADNGIINGINTLISGNNGNNLDAAILGVETLTGSSNALIKGVSELKSGSAQLAAGLKQVDASMPTLVDGSAALDEGAGELKNGTSQLLAGAATLVSGTKELHTGTTTLKNGTETLKNGTDALVDGTDQLLSGATELKEGAGKLEDGAKELSEGMAKFDEEAIRKISDLLQTDLTGVYDRFKAVVDYAGEYKSFTGSADDTDTGVKFLIRTDAIEEE